MSFTVEGIDALVAWASGELGAGDRLRACEHRADEQKRELRRALTVAFTTPLEPEDLFELSRGLEKVYRQAMSALIASDDLREVAAERELYRRLAGASEDLREAAERVWYSVLKQR